MQTIVRIIILCLSLAMSVHSYGYGMLGRGAWMSPFRPYLPSPFMSPFTSGFAAGFGSGLGGGSGIPAAGLGFNLGLGGGFGPGFGGAGGYGLKRAGFSPFLPAPAFGGLGMGGIPVPGAGMGGGISPFASPFAAASSYRPVAAFPPAFAYPFSGFGSRATFGAVPLMPAPLTASSLASSQSMGSYASSSKPQFTVMKMGASSSSSGSSDPKEVTVADGISDQDLVAEATGRRKYIYGFKGRKYYVGKPWDVFSKK